MQPFVKIYFRPLAFHCIVTVVLEVMTSLLTNQFPPGSGMDVPFWEFGGSTVVSSSYVRLTPDRQSKQGSLWNTVVR